MTLKRRAVLACLTGIIALGGSTLAATPASASTFVVCDSWPAPSISASGGYFTAHYYHLCNTITGLTEMVGDIWIWRDNGDGKPSDGDQLVAGRRIVSAPQREAAGTTQYAVGSNHGHYYAEESLYFWGPDVTSGPAPHGGCGRIPSGEIRCWWYTSVIFG